MNSATSPHTHIQISILQGFKGLFSHYESECTWNPNDEMARCILYQRSWFWKILIQTEEIRSDSLTCQICNQN